MIRRLAAWLVRPQYSVLLVAAAFAVGSLGGSRIPWWAGLAWAAGIGAGCAVVSDLLNRFLRRKARQS